MTSQTHRQFQHRSIKAGLNIILTDYNNLFTRDFYLPTGDLRDLKSSYKRSEIIVVTKCKTDLTEVEKQKIIKEISPLPDQQIFFTAIEYGLIYHISNKREIELDNKTDVLLVTGIANPRPLKKCWKHIATATICCNIQTTISLLLMT